MATIPVSVDTADGVEVHNLDLDFGSLTMRESVRLEQTLGVEAFDVLAAQVAAGTPVMRPSLIQALVFVKLKSVLPDLTVDQFDLDLEPLQGALEAVAGEAVAP